jgi:caffeoyl-CoA O-methyltransferase
MPFELPSTLSEYIERHTTPPSGELTALEAETRESTSAPQMLTGSVEGRFLEILAFTSGAKEVLEIGTFTGYGTLSLASGLADGGRVVTCEISEEHAAIARRHIEASPLADRIDLRIGAALETIAAEPGPFDLVFIDADKPAYVKYYEAVLPKLAPRGLIIADNTLWGGDVAKPPADDDSENLVALRVFNDHVAADPRVVAVMLSVRDGMTLIRLAG